VPVLFETTTAQALGTLCALALAAMAPQAAADLGVSSSLIGYQVAGVYLGAMASSLFGGGLVRRLGATRTGQLSLWLAAAGCALSATGGLATLAAGALVIGAGYGLVNPPASQLLSRLGVVRHMNLVFSLKQCGVPFGAMLAGLLMPPLALQAGWRTALLACGACALLLSVQQQRVRDAWDTDRDAAAPLFAAPFASLGLIVRHGVLRWLAPASFLLSAVQLSLSGFLVTYLVAEGSFDLVGAGKVLAVAHAAGAAGRLAWGWLADRLRSGARALIANCVLAIAGALATAAIAPDWPAWLVAAAAALFGFTSIGWNGVFMAIIARQAPQSIGSATGGTLFVTFAGVVVGPALFAQLHDRAGMSYSAGFASLSLLSAAAIGCLVLARRYNRP
jgi:MFS family permease